MRQSESRCNFQETEDGGDNESRRNQDERFTSNVTQSDINSGCGLLHPTDNMYSFGKVSGFQTLLEKKNRREKKYVWQKAFFFPSLSFLLSHTRLLPLVTVSSFARDILLLHHFPISICCHFMSHEYASEFQSKSTYCRLFS